MQARPSPPPLGVAFDSSFDEGIDQVLALALLFGLEGRRQLRLPSVSTSRHNLDTAIFLDLFARFYGGEQAGDFVVNRSPLPIGMSEAGRRASEVPAMLAAVIQRRDGEQFVYPRSIDAVNDTADPVALIRNALSAQVDGNAAIVLAGPPVNVLKVHALPDGRAIDAVYGRDFPLVQAAVLFMGVVFLVVNFVVDMLYVVLDPRISYVKR